MLALVPASYTLSPHSAKTTSTPLVPSVVSLHSAQSVSEPWYARAMASSTVSASTVLVNSVTSYATTVNIISAPSESNVSVPRTSGTPHRYTTGPPYSGTVSAPVTQTPSATRASSSRT